jgi:hypothetical protein
VFGILAEAITFLLLYITGIGSLADRLIMSIFMRASPV